MRRKTIKNANTSMNFKAATIKMLPLATKKIPGTNEKLEVLSKETEDKRRAK